VQLRVNGRTHEVDADPSTPLLFVLRNDLGLTAAKLGCGLEQCGACTVLADGEPALSCVAPAGGFQGRELTTLEGLAAGGQLHPVQRAFLDEAAAQCGYCTSGTILTAVALLERSASPSRAEIAAALDGNLCRCGSQPRVVRAIERAARVGR
jgi:nicotinate dehydrogenase subunit A